MKSFVLILAIAGLLALSAGGCTVSNGNASPNDTGKVATDEFNKYWRQGKAELSRYVLKQARYGELHEGQAVLIFVTEDFLTGKQVKSESAKPDPDAIPIMKLNMMKRFPTGIYTYSMMNSVFTPLEIRAQPRTLKITSGTQEWCGQVYTQLNLRDGNYAVTGHSYFENEADQAFNLEGVMTEEEIWTRIRLAPGSLPMGAVKLIPGILQSRLRHIPLAVEEAQATLEATTGGGTARYTVTYPKTQRTLSIVYDVAFPHIIQSWSETYKDGFGPDAKNLTTTATLAKTMMLDYWKRHNNADLPLRGEFGNE